MKPSLFTRLAQGLLLTGAALLFTCVLLEILLRFLPVDQGLHTQPVNAEHPYMRFEPNRTAIWSRFPDFSMRNTVHVNNAGFVSDTDYEPNAPGPLLAVIGDSYVEAAMVPWAETVQGRLSKALAPEARVYSFGASGAPLSQYLAYASFVRQTYHPQAMVFVVVGNDFDESLLEYKSLPGFHYFEETPGGLRLTRVDFAPSLLVRLVRFSSLARYLAVNLRLAAVVQGLFHDADQGSGTDEYVGQTSAQAGQHRLEVSRRAVDAFLKQLPQASGLSPDRMLFLMDGLRPHLYDPSELAKAKGSYADLMRGYMMERARALGFLVADLQPLFIQGWEERGQRFEFPRDGHWNGLGHEVAYEAVLDSGLPDVLKDRDAP